MAVLPMFPIGSVLFPRGVLPLQVFEPRYRELVSDVLADDGRFGVVLIERGSDVGGGDVRSSIGTVAQIAEKGVLDDGRIILLNVGIERVRVVRWLEDDPYPRADVAAHPDAPSRGLQAAVERVAAARRRLAALAVEMGADSTDLDVELPDDAAAAAWELCVMAPLGPFDQQKLLEADDPVVRMRLLERMLENDRRDLEEIMRRDTRS
jgi:Lon protease-like protein